MPQSRFIPYKDTLPNDLSLVREDILNALQAGLQRVQRHCPSSKPGIYIGAGGHILTTWHLFDALPAQRQTLPALRADLSQFPLSRPSSASRASFLETAVGTASLVLAQHLRAPALDEPAAKRVAAAAKVVGDAVRLGVTEERDEDGCEVLYGRAGLLYALLFLRAEVRRAGRDVGKGEEGGAAKGKTGSLVAPLVDGQNVGALVDDIVARGAIGAEAYAREVRNPDVHVPPLMWSWHGKRYLGGAHGVAGILQMLLCCPSHLVERHWSAIEGTIEWLLGLQQPSGNWPHKASRHGAAEAEEDDPLIQWCHGAPGVLILLAMLLREHELKPRMAQAVRDALAKGGRVVYERGLLRKGVGLCHGVAGSVYTLLAVSDALDDPEKPKANGEWFRAALHLAHLACSYESLTARGEMATPDRPYSLYEGVAGMCCGWGDVLALLDGMRRRAGMPGYDDLDDM